MFIIIEKEINVFINITPIVFLYTEISKFIISSDSKSCIMKSFIMTD